MKRRNRIGFGAVVLCAVLLGVFTAGCGKKQDESAQTKQPAQSTVIVMGGVYPMTGPLAVFGTAAADGLREGVAYANAKILAGTPYRLEAKVEDSKGEPQAGVLAYRRLVDSDRARIVNAILSNVAVSLKPLADQDGVLLFADSTHSSLTGGMTLRHSQTAEQEATFLLAHCRDQLKASSIYAVVTDDDYGVSLEKAFGTGIDAIRYDPKAADLNAVAARVVQRNPDAVILVGVGGPLGELIRTVREMGYKGQLVSAVSFDVVPSTRQVAGDAAKGLWFPRLVQTPQAMAEAHADAAALPPVAGASTIRVIAFNDAVFTAMALAQGHKEPVAIRQYLLKQEKLTGIGTEVRPQADGTLLPALEMVQVQ